MSGMKALIEGTSKTLLDASARKVILSGPSGFLGSKVLDTILDVHVLRHKNGINPGEVILLSSSPGRLMERLHKKYGIDRMRTVRASRVDYYTQHDVDTWIDQMGSLGKPFVVVLILNLSTFFRTRRTSFCLRESSCSSWACCW